MSAVVSVRGLMHDELKDRVDLAVEGGVPVNAISRTRLPNVPNDIGSLVNPSTKSGVGDEDVGLPDDGRARAIALHQHRVLANGRGGMRAGREKDRQESGSNSHGQARLRWCAPSQH